MNIEVTDIFAALFIGLGATAFMDACGLLLRRTMAIPLPNFRLVGRWVCCMPQGHFRHDNIAAVPQQRGEHAIGWTVHYLVGIAFALILVMATSGEWVRRPSLLIAAAFGVATVAIPFFVMQPAMGMGVAAARSPNPAKARLGSLRNHLIFGIGLYMAAMLLVNAT